VSQTASGSPSQHGTAGPVRICVGHPHWAGGANLQKEPAVASVAHSRRSILVWTCTATRSRWGSWSRTSKSPRSTGSLMTSQRCAVSLAASVTPAGCEPATRPARSGSNWPGCCTAWASAPGDRAVADPQGPGDKVKTDKCDCRRLARLHRAGELVAIRIPTVQQAPSGTCAAPAPIWSLTAPALGIGCRSSCSATAAASGAAGRPRGPTPTSAS
jgi:hypothetical protein